MKKRIIISRMFTGKYLGANLGHEAINIFKADKREGEKTSRHFIYLNAYGTFGKELVHVDKEKHKELAIDAILLVKPIGNGLAEVVAKACNLTMCYDPTLTKEENLRCQKELCKTIHYGGASLGSIFDGYEQQDTFVTFEAGKVLAPKSRILIHYASAAKQNSVEGHSNVISLSETNIGQILYNIVEEGSVDYENIQRVITDESLWKDDFQTVSGVQFSRPMTLLEIMGKEDSELAYSNMIRYWLERDKQLFKRFINEVLRKKDNTIPKPTDDISIRIEREKENIDLLISYGTARIIIENKIKAEVSVYKNGENQLSKYREQLEKDGFEPKCFMLSPNYRDLSAEEEENGYHNLKYDELFEFFDKQKEEDMAMTDCEMTLQPFQYDEFCRALELHANPTDDRNYIKMMRRMEEAIERAKR